MPKNYYLILGVPLDAAPEIIRSAYRELAKRYHPDHGGAGDAGAFREISEAYRVLSDPERRAGHDRALGLGRFAAEPMHAVGAPLGAPEPLVAEAMPLSGDDPSVIRPSLEALFERVARNFPGFAGRDLPKSEHPEALDFELILSPEEAARGVVVPFEVPVFRTCPWCGGTGRDWLFPCAPCDEQGHLVDRETVKLHVPAGVRPGSVIEVSLASVGVENLWLRVHVRVTRG